MGILALSGASAQGRTSTTEETGGITIRTASLRMAEINSVFAGSDGDEASVTPSATADSPIMSSTGLAALTPPDSDFLDGFKASQVVHYTVQQGDTIGSIAADYGVSIDTVVWANAIKNPNALSLGQVLKIPPVTGVIHTVKAGDTVASIAKKYNAKPAEILSFNTLREGQSLITDTELMVPGGELPGPKPVISAAARGSGGHGIYVPVGNGQCVDFVQAHGYPNLHGNAYLWANYINTPAPVVGGVVVLKGGRFGHVAIVTAITPDSIQIVEQNYYGPYIIDHRQISLSDKSIVGFIR